MISIIICVVICIVILLCFNNFLLFLENKQIAKESEFLKQRRFDKLPEAEQYRIDRDSLWKMVFDEHEKIKKELTKTNKSNRKANRQIASLKKQLGLGAFKAK